MSSASIMDYLAEIFYTYSSKMKGDSYQPNISSFLMNRSNSPVDVINDLPKLLGDLKDSTFHVETSLSNHPLQPLLRPFRLLEGFRSFYDTDKPSYFSDKPSHFSNYHSENWLFSPHLFNLVSDSYRYRYSHIDSTFIPSTAMVLRSALNQDKEAILINSSAPSHHPESEKSKTVCDLSATKETEMLVDVNVQSPMAKNSTAEVKCDISHSLRLNLELAQRKTKEMNKRSKRRRRRQKKSEQLSGSSSTSTSDDDADSELQSPVTSIVSLVAESPNFECTLSVTHTVQMSPCRSFLIPVESDSDDDSDWETIDIEELSSNNNVTSGSERSCGSFSCDSSPVKSERSDSVSSSPIKCSFQVSRSLMSFVAPESDSDDDNSDWDSCETALFTEDAEFEFTGLFLTNLSTPHTATLQCDIDSVIIPEQECNEMVKLRAALLEANKKWKEFSEKSAKPKSASKVTFAPAEELVEVFSVEVFERKGEWETYATERLRFKRKIDELEKVLSPFLNTEHRSKIFKEIVEPNL